MQPIERNAGRDAFRPTVVCLHASGSAGAQWKALGEALRPDFHVQTPDLIGHGDSTPWDGPAGAIVDADTERVARILDDVATDVHLVGHSYGGTIAMRVAARNPVRLASVAVFEPMPVRLLFDDDPLQPAAGEIAEVAADIRRALNHDDRARAAALLVDYGSGNGQWDRLPPDQRAAIARRMPDIAEHFAALMGDKLRLRDFAAIAVPVLYLTGSQTRSSPRRVAQLLQGVLPAVEPVTMQGMGHLGAITHPHVVASRIAQFVRTRAAARTGFERKAA